MIFECNKGFILKERKGEENKKGFGIIFVMGKRIFSKVKDAVGSRIEAVKEAGLKRSIKLNKLKEILAKGPIEIVERYEEELFGYRKAVLNRKLRPKDVTLIRKDGSKEKLTGARANSARLKKLRQINAITVKMALLHKECLLSMKEIEINEIAKLLDEETVIDAISKAITSGKGVRVIDSVNGKRIATILASGKWVDWKEELRGTELSSEKKRAFLEFNTVREVLEKARDEYLEQKWKEE